MAHTGDIMTATQYTPTLHGGSNNNGHRHNGNIFEARGRFLKLANTKAPFTIFCGGRDGMLGWASTVCEPEKESRSTIRLLALLLLRNRKLLATRRKVFGFPALAVEMIERELLAKRRDVLGVRSWGGDRSARQVVLGDSRAATVAVGA